MKQPAFVPAVITLASDLGGTRMKIGVMRAGQVLAQTNIPANSPIPNENIELRQISLRRCP